MRNLIASLVIITVSMSTGYLIQQLAAHGRIQLPLSLVDLRKCLQRIALLGISPFATITAIWGVEVQSIRIAALPFIGAGAIVLGGLLAYAGTRLLRLAPRQAGALIPCGAFTNIGSIGALICYYYLGEPGFALVPIYKLFEELTYYGLGFPLAKAYSTADRALDTTAERLRALARDPFILVTLSSILLGGVLNLAGLTRPSVLAAVNAVLIPLGTGLMLVSIGLAMRFSQMGHYKWLCGLVAGIKFVAVPLASVLCASLLGLGEIDEGLALKVVLILSAMPVAFTALIPPSIYDLDLDLANACWFVTTGSLVVVLPVLLYLINVLP
ncbi:MAG: hypothetical protein QNJ22_18730 [Desulfosarcinaceae bacterium]|nr:hypothetical protein [Desulfosarcinaceae bacterium]